MSNTKFDIYIDCTSIISSDYKAGIQRVERNLITEILKYSHKNKIECRPVFLLGKKHYILLNEIKYTEIGYFNIFSLKIRNFLHFRRLIKAALPNEQFCKFIDKNWGHWIRWFFVFPMAFAILPLIIFSILYSILKSSQKNNRWYPKQSDVLIIAGGSWWEYSHIVVALKNIKMSGCSIMTIIHDIIPILYKDLIDKKHKNIFEIKFKKVCKNSNIIIANSLSTKESIEKYLKSERIYNVKVSHFKFGVKLDLVDQKNKIRQSLINFYNKKERRPYLCVGTIEPKKNHKFLLKCFDIIWQKNENILLCIVGRKGWLSEDIVSKIEKNALYGENLMWFNDINDCELKYCYENAHALVYPSKVEGFGLPLIEALYHKCIVVASDISTFREIGGKYCTYFSLDNEQDLVDKILYDSIHKDLSGFRWPSWEESACEFIEIISKEILK